MASTTDSDINTNNNDDNDNSSSQSSWIPKLPPVVHRIERGEKMPVCLIVVGMAGSGKSSLMGQLHSNLEEKAIAKAEEQEKETLKEQKQKQQQQQEKKMDIDNNTEEDDEIDIDETWYCVNLDPATLNVNYDVSIDIRDTINYKQVMKQHKLGPNGAIMTSLNLFATKFDQVISILEKRCFTDDDINVPNGKRDKNEISNNSELSNEKNATNDTTTTTTHLEAATAAAGESSSTSSNTDPSSTSGSTIEYILVDTPGQIEAFTWSASGSIICESLASICPTVVVFVIDTVRCAASPNTFMSNMLYACSILYRTRLPIVIAFNKIDVVSCQFCMEWMHDYEIFQQALDDDTAASNGINGGGGFYSSLTRSLSLALDEFYSNFAHAVGVSAVTGQGIEEFWNVVQKAATHDFVYDYVDDLKLRVEEQVIKQQAIARTDIKRLQRDLNNTNNIQRQHQEPSS